VLILLAGTALAAGVAPLAGHVAAAGPPYPAPVTGQRVYDTAGVFSPDTISGAEQSIRAVEERTGAQIAVYTQLKPESDTPELAEADARALMDQWGVGRRGFDDGLVILFDLDTSLRHGQVQLYAGPGFEATFLTQGERQAIYENDMLPLLREGDLDGALVAALAKVDAAATPEHANRLQTARQVNALLGLGGVLLALALVGWWLWSWLRYGRDPVYLDDPSILMAGPPAGLTPASAALVRDGRSTRHTLTTALLDLASRGEIAFRFGRGPGSYGALPAEPEHQVQRWGSPERALRGFPGPRRRSADTGKIGVEIRVPDPGDPAFERNRVRPLGRAENVALDRLRSVGAGSGGYLDGADLLQFGTQVGDFDRELERASVAAGWFTREPGSAIRRWAAVGIAECVIAVIALIAGSTLVSDGLILMGVCLLAGGLITAVGALAMPARTMAGAMIRAMLEAYRRTLQKTLEQARSMTQVVESRVLPWLDTPDQAVVWGTALGLHDEVQHVLERSLDDARSGGPAATGAWFPFWYGGVAGATFGGGGGWPGIAPGLFSASAIPDIGSMFSAIGTIGNSPSSSGGGGFGGGGSGGGGGGAGGGF
jgi:uncharacterized membrane protein YgcG